MTGDDARMDIIEADAVSAAEVARLQDALKSTDKDRTWFVDFDHTLFLPNSTEVFLRSAQPYAIYALLLAALKILRPWQLKGAQSSFVWRDTIRALSIIVLAPWTLLTFPAKARRLFREQLNRKLDAMLADVPIDQIVIVSFGFRFVIKALVAGTRYEHARLVAPSLFGAIKARKNGKIAMLAAHGMSVDKATDVMITDNATDDADIMAACQDGFDIQWTDAQAANPITPGYVPFFYTAKIKRDPAFFIKQVALEELPIVLLAYGLFGWGFSVSSWIALGLLFAALIIVYEIGYAENDQVGLRNEAKPKLTDAFFKYQHYRVAPHAWIWGGVVTVLAIAILPDARIADMLTRLGLGADGSSMQGHAILVGIWIGVLVISRLAFWLFNTVTLPWRVFAYLPLHISKYFGFALLFPIAAIGLALLYAHIVRTWALYAVRRAGGDIEFLSSQFVRFAFLIFLVPVLALAIGDMSILAQWQTWVIIGFCGLRAIPEIRRKMF